MCNIILKDEFGNVIDTQKLCSFMDNDIDFTKMSNEYILDKLYENE